MVASTLSKLPSADEIHAELTATLRHADALRKLLRISEKASSREERQTSAESKPAKPDREATHA